MRTRSEQDYVVAIIEVCSEFFSADDISAQDNFFMLGGTSLNAVELTEELLARHRVDLPLDAVFASDTLAELAGYCTRAASVPDA